MTRLRRAALAAVALLLLPWALLALLAAATPLPPELRGGSFAGSTRVLDRQGRLLRHARAGDGTWMQRVSLDEVGEILPRAVLAAEDRRFYWHPGVDPLSVARALAQLAWNRRIVSGGSTLTQQLARTLVPRPRTAWGKAREMALALRIEASLSKRQIFEEYLSRVSFGPSVRGVEAAARSLFDRPARELSLAEAALLAGLPQGPSAHDPRARPDRALRRRDLVLARMQAAGLASPPDVERALREPITLTRFRPEPLAPHLIEALLAGKLSGGPAAELTTTLDASLQRSAEESTRRVVALLEARQVSAASVVVLDNDSGDILAYVGSPSISDARRLGANDGVLARRQPGSSLKPFVYGLAFERLGWGPATLLHDVEISFPAGDATFTPRNYDGKFHGPVRLREALGSSLNVPAVWAAATLGPELVLDRLHDLGMASLDQPAERYGAAIALGDGEVSLLELAQAYAALARGGLFLPARALLRRRPHGAPEAEVTQPPPRRVLDEGASALLTSILSDPRARLSAFGAGNVLEFAFPVAAKTGTSKGFRDNIAAGYTREVTVVAWVGNFDGRPMRDVSGIAGAGPLFHEVMEAAMASRPPRPLAGRPLETRAVCSLSGAAPGPDCPHSIDESFLPASPALEPCSMHRRLPVDRRNGLLAGPLCPPSEVDERLFEVYPGPLLAWARGAGRPAPPASSPRCPAPSLDGDEAPRITSPRDGATLFFDHHLSARQELVIQIDASSASKATLHVNERSIPLQGPPFSYRWPLTPGEARLWVEAGGRRSEPVIVRVE